MDASSHPSHAYVLIGLIQKPFGLLGEVKIKPETFDFDRHEQLKKVTVRLRETGELKNLEVRGSRADARYWYLKFKGLGTPEAASFLSGGELLLPEAQKLDLPSDMVYYSDLPGCEVFDENGTLVGTVIEVIDQGIQQLLRLQLPQGDTLVPWNDHFIKKIDKVKKRVDADLGPLRGVTL